MKLESLRDVLAENLRELYNAESQLLRALPKMAKAASSQELQRLFTAHLEETKEHVTRLEHVCELLGIKVKGKMCLAMKGLIDEGAAIIALKGDPAAKDAALIGAAQKIEHYEIAGYGTARTFASILGEDELASLLQETLDEEGTADEVLTAIAEAGLNQQAAGGESEEAEDEEAAEKESRVAAAPA